jgi:hypothetical protein
VAQRVQPLGSVHADHEHLSVTFGLDDGHVISHRERVEWPSLPPYRPWEQVRRLR